MCRSAECLNFFRIHNYIVAGFQWNALFAVGVPLLCIGFLWLIKRTVTLHCPDTISCLRGRMGCAEKDLWDDDLSDDQQRSENELVRSFIGIQLIFFEISGTTMSKLP